VYVKKGSIIVTYVRGVLQGLSIVFETKLPRSFFAFLNEFSRQNFFVKVACQKSEVKVGNTRFGAYFYV
jgi:hypothetical protein